MNRTRKTEATKNLCISTIEQSVAGRFMRNVANGTNDAANDSKIEAETAEIGCGLCFVSMDYTNIGSHTCLISRRTTSTTGWDWRSRKLTFVGCGLKFAMPTSISSASRSSPVMKWVQRSRNHLVSLRFWNCSPSCALKRCLPQLNLFKVDDVFCLKCLCSKFKRHMFSVTSVHVMVAEGQERGRGRGLRLASRPKRMRQDPRCPAPGRLSLCHQITKSSQHSRTSWTIRSSTHHKSS